MKGINCFWFSISAFLVSAQNFEKTDFEQQDEFVPLRNGDGFDVKDCKLSETVRADIKGYSETVQKIFDTAQAPGGAFVGKTYRDLEYFVDKFGSRLSGSSALESSIDFVVREMMVSGLAHVHTENATVPHWERGEEEATLISPRRKSLAVTALGLSVATPKGGITAPVVVIEEWKTLIGQQRGDIKGKILVYTGNASVFSLFGGGLASQHGAVACLIRSVTPMSLNTPHTGIQFYDPAIQKIPIGSISPEDADLLTRLQAMGEELKVFLRLDILVNDTTQSRNAIGDYTGSTNPDEIVLVSGHIDSWDVGQGAVDDGVGLMLSLEVTRLLQFLNLTPRRTVRTVAWTAEEMGLYGARAWMKDHKTQLSRYVAALESDYGCFKAMGYIFMGKPEVGCILNEIRALMPTVANLSMISNTKFMPTDIAYMAAYGVPSIVLNGNDGKYFWYHHTEADVLTAMDSKELDVCLAVWAATTFVIADMKEPLPFGF